MAYTTAFTVSRLRSVKDAESLPKERKPGFAVTAPRANWTMSPSDVEGWTARGRRTGWGSPWSAGVPRDGRAGETAAARAALCRTPGSGCRPHHRPVRTARLAQRLVRCCEYVLEYVLERDE
ncbi:hypothetical protein RGQ21_02400 [Kitasatospora aureofaciens]|nr:hypothetical protein RGQ21_02400 [Kitasatospora aureofaciens]